MNVFHSAIAVLAAMLMAAGANDTRGETQLAAQLQESTSRVAGAVPRNPLRQAYFGELHVHTMNSPDAFMLNVRTTPSDAYRFARGEAIEHSSGARLQLGQALDFIAVTDHSEYMGILPRLLDPDSELGKLALAAQLQSRKAEENQHALLEVLMTLGSGKPLTELVDPKLRHAIWREYVQVADLFYQPGEFTTLIGYEWTSSGGMSEINLHRNVIFRGNRVPEQPFSSFDSVEPRELWTWMDEQREQGIESMAISHNANLSNGLMFPSAKVFAGEPLDSDYAELRQRNEPLAEITQIKGTSETHPLLSPNDEWSGFEILEDLLGGSGVIGQAQGSYARDAWLTGLVLEETQGFNPYRFGVVGASDSHNASSQVEENNYHGKIGVADGTAETRRGGSFINVQHVKYSAAGLAGVWAESNTREDVYDALARREAFATTGPRISVRFFGSWEWPANALENPEWVEKAHRVGVPMGGDLPAASSPEQAPAFLVWATKDPASAWLQRVQIIKGWVEEGEKREQVYDVACADGLQPDPATHRCPDNGASVDVDSCDFDREKGDVQLRSVWRDPDFAPDQRAFYYARVLENPTCRWSTWDSLRHNMPLPDDVPPTLQERAYTSPIWYRPNAS